MRSAVGFNAGFLSLVDIQDGTGFYVVAVPKISKKMGKLWIGCPGTVIMAYGGEYVARGSVRPEEKKYARAIEVDFATKLVFTDKVRERVLAARNKDHEVLHEILYREGGGFAQHSLRPNCEAVIENDGVRVLIRSIENIFFGQCITIHYGQECVQWMLNNGQEVLR